MSRIVDVHKVQLKLLEESKNIRHFDKDRKKSQIFADGIDFAWVMLDNAPIVEAIPIEYIQKWNNNFIADSMRNGRTIINQMLEDWEKENEQTDSV